MAVLEHVTGGSFSMLRFFISPVRLLQCLWDGELLKPLKVVFWLRVGNCRASFPAKLLAHDFCGLLLDAPHLWSLSIRLVASSLLSLEGSWAALHAFYFSVLTPPLCCLTLSFRSFQALLSICLWAESRNSLIGSVSEQTIWTMRKERNILLQLGFHGILGKLLLNFEVLSFQDLLAWEKNKGSTDCCWLLYCVWQHWASMSGFGRREDNKVLWRALYVYFCLCRQFVAHVTRKKCAFRKGYRSIYCSSRSFVGLALSRTREN